jgi:hypothetical protein
VNLSCQKVRGAAPGVVQAAHLWWAQVVDCVFQRKLLSRQNLSVTNLVTASAQSYSDRVRWVLDRCCELMRVC